MNEAAKHLASHTGAIGLGMWVAAWLIRKESFSAILKNQPWAAMAEWLALVGVVTFAVGVGAWMLLDLLEHGVSEELKEFVKDPND